MIVLLRQSGPLARVNRSRWLSLAIFLAGLGALSGTQLAGQTSQDTSEEEHLARLIRDLADDDLARRRDAAFSLGQLGPRAEPAVGALTAALEDDDPQVWLDSVQALSRIGPPAHPAVAKLATELDSRDPQRRYRASFALGRIGPASLGELRQALADRSPLSRESAARAIGFMGPAGEPVLGDLVKLLADDNEAVRRQAADALGSIGPSAEPPLQKALSDDTASARSAAAWALRVLGASQPETWRELYRAGQDHDPSVRAAAIVALSHSKAPREEVARFVSTALQDDDLAVRDAAVAALMKLGSASENAVPELVALLDSEDASARASAAYALGRIGPSARTAAPALLAAMRRRTEEAGYLSQTLGRLGPSILPAVFEASEKPDAPCADLARAIAIVGPPAVPSVIQAAGHASPQVRQVVAIALGDITPPTEDAIQALGKLLGDEDALVQARAAEALGKSGAGAVSQSDRLAAQVEHSDPRVRAAVLVALCQIAPERGLTRIPFGLRDSQASVRRAAVDAIDALFSINPQARRNISLLEGLVSSLADSEPTVRQRSATVLGQCLGRAKVGDSDPASGPLDSRFVAVAVADLIQALADPEPTVRKAAAEALGAIGPEAAVADEALAARLDDSSPEVVLAAVRALGAIGDAAESGPEVAKLLSRPEAEMRGAAIDALVEFQEQREKNTAVFIQALDDPEWTVRRSAAVALGRIGAPARAAMPKLFGLLSNEVDREAARSAIRQIDDVGPEAVEALVQALEAEDRTVRFFAVYYLGKLGPSAAEALPALRKLDGEDSQRFRKSIQDAIRAIEGRPPETAP